MVNPADEGYFGQVWDTDIHDSDLNSEADFVTLIIKDAADTSIGGGLKFRVGAFDHFKYAFDTFKIRSCADCRPPEELRFKTTTGAVKEHQTAANLNIETGDTLQINVHSTIPDLTCRHCEVKPYPSSIGIMDNVRKPLANSSATLAASANRTAKQSKNKAMVITVRDQTNYSLPVKMRETSEMSFLMERYATNAVRESKTLRFFFEGERVMKDDTPKKLGICDGDKVDVFIEQFGG